MPFLEVLTRTYKRPTMLTVNQASLAAQSDPDYIQTLLVDEVGRGIAWSYENIAAYAPHLVGDYIWVLDDDDMCVYPNLITELKEAIALCDPDVIFVRMDHGAEMGILPGKHWGAQPQEGQIGVSAYIVRRAVWQMHAQRWGARYAGDFDFIDAVYHSGVCAYWLDVIASSTQRGRNLGKPE